MRRERCLLWVVASLGLLAATGCMTTIRGDVLHPPALPARIYPFIVVLHRGTPVEVDFAQSLANHLLSSGDSQVRVMSAQEIAQMTSGLPQGTVVVQIQLDSAQSMRMDYVPTYGTTCGWYSCYSTSGSVAVPVPTLMTRLTAQLRDGQTAQVLVTQTAESEGDVVQVRASFERLFRRLVAWIDGTRETIEVDIQPPSDDRTDRGIAALERGDFALARRELDALFQANAYTGWSAKNQSRFFFALAIARRFDPTDAANVDAHFGAAMDACQRAMALAQEDRYTEFYQRLQVDAEEARRTAALAAEAARYRSLPPPAPVPANPPAPAQPTAPAPAPVTPPTQLPIPTGGV